MKVTINFLTKVLAVFSLVSFTQRLFDVGIFSMFETYLSYYRQVAYFFFGNIWHLFGITVPPKLIDLWVLSFLGAGAYVKTENIQHSRFLINFKLEKVSLALKLFLFSLFGFSGIGIGIAMASISPTTYVYADTEEQPAIMQGVAKNLLIIVSATIVFFVLNAFTPTV